MLGIGLRPRPDSPPALVRGAAHALYRYELRRLRDAHRAGHVAQADFSARVIGLRRKYWPLTLQLSAWEAICSGAA